MGVQHMLVIQYLIHGTNLSFPFVLFFFGLSIALCFLYNYVCKLALIGMKILENNYQR